MVSFEVVMKNEADRLQQRLDAVNVVLNAYRTGPGRRIVVGPQSNVLHMRKHRPIMSPATRKKIGQAVRARHLEKLKNELAKR